MPEIDKFASALLEEAKRFLELGTAARNEGARDAFLHAALLVAFSSLEAHLNAIAEDFLVRKDLSAHERAILSEKEVRLEDGEFVLGGLRMSKMEDRISFLHRRFSGAPLDKQAQWWGDLGGAISLRNKLVHPKEAQAVTVKAVQVAITSIINTVDALYLAIYRKGFPAAKLGLQSQMDF
jgi:hypothetical protein